MKSSFQMGKLAFIVLIMLILLNSAYSQIQYFTDESPERLPVFIAIPIMGDAADIDQDGDIDVTSDAWAAIPPYDPYFLLINNGSALFTLEHYERYPDTSFESYAAHFGDIDNDADYDVYFVAQGYQDFLLINDGLGYFHDESSQRLPPYGDYNLDIVFGDFTGDLFLDLVSVCPDDGLNYFFVNDGFGFFEDLTVESMPIDTTDDLHANAADLDNDFDLDLIIAWDSGIEPAIRGLDNHEGRFEDFEVGRMDNRRSRWIDFADIDNDGDLDIIISGILSLGLLINQNYQLIDETADRIPSFAPDSSGINPVGLGDFDNDGDIDIYIGRATDRADIYLVNNGEGYYDRADERIPSTLTSTRWVEPFDADLDGDLDLFLGCSGSGQQRILINHSTPDTIPPRLIASDLPVGEVDTSQFHMLNISACDNISVEKGALRVIVHYRIDGGAFISADFIHRGSTLYGYAIEGQEPETVVDYYIELRDKMDNVTTIPPEAPDSLLTFEVDDPVGISGQLIDDISFDFQIYPNPSNSEFLLSYNSSDEVKVAIYDISGRMIHSESLKSGKKQKWHWEGWPELPSGIYFIELGGVDIKEVKKATLIR